jgi:hypothetical protein
MGGGIRQRIKSDHDGRWFWQDRLHCSGCGRWHGWDRLRGRPHWMATGEVHDGRRLVVLCHSCGARQ